MSLNSSQLLKLIDGKRYELHCHSRFSDGQNSLEEMILRAIDLKIEVLGISDHAPIPFKKVKWSVPFTSLPLYREEMQTLKEKYKDKITLLMGLEVDYFMGCENHLKETLKIESYDYTIGSVHFFNLMKSDGTTFLGIDSSPDEVLLAIQVAGGIEKLTQNYFDLMLKCARTEQFTFLAHFDLVKKYNFKNCYFDETSSWYQDQVYQTLKNISLISEVALEINTSAIRKGHFDFYPSKWIVQMIKDLKISLIVNSDAHNIDDLGKNLITTQI